MDFGQDPMKDDGVLVRRLYGITRLNISPPCSIRKRNEDSELDLVRCLIDAGADINAVDGEGRTPLDWAYKGAPLSVQQLLVDNGANWRVVSFYCDLKLEKHIPIVASDLE